MLLEIIRHFAPNPPRAALDQAAKAVGPDCTSEACVQVHLGHMLISID